MRLPRLHRTAPFLRAYRFLPHRLLNGAAGLLSRLAPPRPIIDLVVAAWVRGAAIDLSDFEDRRYRTVEDFFLRRLRSGARPIGPGLVAPVDGRVVAAGPISPASTLRVKGVDLSIDALVNGVRPGGDRTALDAWRGGQAAVLFLSPDGYHRIHAPAGGVLEVVRFLPGRFFPQNDDALRHIPRVHERNQRLVLRLRTARPGMQPAEGDGELLLVLVGASLVGEIVVEPIPQRGRTVRAGDEVGHFRFGSTVVVLLPAEPPWRLQVHAGDPIKMGQTLALAPA